MLRLLALLVSLRLQEPLALVKLVRLLPPFPEAHRRQGLEMLPQQRLVVLLLLRLLELLWQGQLQKVLLSVQKLLQLFPEEHREQGHSELKRLLELLL